MVKEKANVSTRVYKEPGGITHTWYFKANQGNLELFKVVIDYPKNYTSQAEEQKSKNKKLPKTKQRFINPKTGKEVSYQRAKELGIIKK